MTGNERSARPYPWRLFFFLLNGFVALGFGYLYWTRGLAAAIVAHFCAGNVLHVIGPVF